MLFKLDCPAGIESHPAYSDDVGMAERGKVLGEVAHAKKHQSVE